MNDDEKSFINTRSPYVLFNVGYYLMGKKLMMNGIADGHCRCKYCKHLLINLDSSTTQTCWLSHNLVNVEGVCEKFEFSQKLYDGYNKGD